MGQKANPRIMRIGINGNTWSSIFCENKSSYAESVKKDLLIRSYISKHLGAAKISDVKIEKISNSYRITLFIGKLGALTGKNMSIVEDLKKYINQVTGAEMVVISFSEIKKHDIDATLIAMSIVKQIESRSNPKRAMKKAAQLAMKYNEVEGIEIKISGRLMGAEIARVENLRLGRVPRHTLNANIDYAFQEAMTTYGMIGVTVLVCKNAKFAV